MRVDVVVEEDLIQPYRSWRSRSQKRLPRLKGDAKCSYPKQNLNRIRNQSETCKKIIAFRIRNHSLEDHSMDPL